MELEQIIRLNKDDLKKLLHGEMLERSIQVGDSIIRICGTASNYYKYKKPVDAVEAEPIASTNGRPKGRFPCLYPGCNDVRDTMQKRSVHMFKAHGIRKTEAEKRERREIYNRKPAGKHIAMIRQPNGKVTCPICGKKDMDRFQAGGHTMGHRHRGEYGPKTMQAVR